MFENYAYLIRHQKNYINWYCVKERYPAKAVIKRQIIEKTLLTINMQKQVFLFSSVNTAFAAYRFGSF